MHKKFISPQHSFILIVTLFLMVTSNFTFFHKLVGTYPLEAANIAFLVSITVFFTLVTALLLNFICYGKATRWALAIIVLLASQASYFMDSYGVVIDTNMLENVIQTDLKEAGELVNFSFIWHTLILGILPVWLILKFCPKSQGLIPELKSKLIFASMLILLLIVVVVPFTSQYANFIREHKTLRFYSNPTYFSYSIVRHIGNYIKPPKSVTLIKVAQDSEEVGEHDKPELLILVVGEAARSDHFSLNGYHRETNPELKKQDVVSFKNVSSCGTSTAVSVPCMFSPLTRAEFNKEKGLSYENALDVLSREGVEILWRDNNSDSKGVALRTTYEDFSKPSTNPVCDSECRDIGMLNGLDEYIKLKKDKDILIVLHQRGNHGPAYYRRYPKDFEKFTPVCKTNDLAKCSNEEIENAYDNAILYTDHFLSKVIEFLKKHDDDHEASMLYVSDHGESLGEYGVYLHGAPYAIAPKAQTHIPALVWLGKDADYTVDQLRPYENRPFSHDDLFCVLLTEFEMVTNTCNSWRETLKHNADFQ